MAVVTVDKVFVAGAISREGLYVSATRGREAIRIFVPDREAFLAAANLKNEARISALEFARQYLLGTDLRSVLARGWRHLLHVRAHYDQALFPPDEPPRPEESVKLDVPATRPRKPVRRISEESESPRRAPRWRTSSPGVRVRF